MKDLKIIHKQQIEFLQACEDIQEEKGFFKVQDIEIRLRKQYTNTYATLKRYFEHDFLEEFPEGNKNSYRFTDIGIGTLKSAVEYKKKKGQRIIEDIQEGLLTDLVSLIYEIKQVEPASIDVIFDHSEIKHRGAVSRKLSKLDNAGLVTKSRTGKKVYYSLNHEALSNLEIGLT